MMADKIKGIRKEFNLTQLQLADKLNVAPSTVSSWELGSNKPLMDKITIMADMFGVPISYFFDTEDLGDLKDKEILPVYGSISCGEGSVVYETTTHYEEAPSKWTEGGEFFYINATGDSMTGANIKEGDLLLIREQPSVENGEIAAVVIDDEVVLKRVYRSDDVFTLVSENPAYPPRTFNPKEDLNIRILGKLKKSITSY